MARENIHNHRIREAGKISAEKLLSMIYEFSKRDNSIETESDFGDFILHLKQNGITPRDLNEEAKQMLIHKLANSKSKELNNIGKSLIEKLRK